MLLRFFEMESGALPLIVRSGDDDRRQLTTVRSATIEEVSLSAMDAAESLSATLLLSVVDNGRVGRGLLRSGVLGAVEEGGRVVKMSAMGEPMGERTCSLGRGGTGGASSLW